MVSRGQELAVLSFVAVVYALLVPIVPFQVFYIVDSNDSSTLSRVWLSGLFYFDAFTRPTGVPMTSANFGVWGQESITAHFSNFGVVFNNVCAFNPASDTANGLGLFPLTLPITVLIVLGLWFFFRKN